MTRKKKKSKYETNTTTLPPHINLYRNIAEDLASSRFYIVEEVEACNHIAPIKSPYKIPQQRSITQTTKVASNAADTEVRSTSQATWVAGNAAVADDRCVDQATKATTADKECTSQSTGIASKGLMSTAVLEMLEAIPDHDFFIQ